MAFSGTLKSFIDGKGFGFIQRDDGQEDVFMHFSKLTNGGSEDMKVGMQLSFDLETDDRTGKQRASRATITSPGSTGGGASGGFGSPLRTISGEASETAVRGSLKSFVDGKGFGFIQRDDGKEDAFVHFSQLKNGGVEDMAIGMRVCFDTEPDPKTGKSRATNVTIEKSGGDGRTSVGGFGFDGRPAVDHAPAIVPQERRSIPESDGGGTYTFSELRVAFTDYSDSDLQGYWRDVCKPAVATQPEMSIAQKCVSFGTSAHRVEAYDSSSAPVRPASMPVSSQLASASGFREWLMDVDASGGLLVYLVALEENFDTTAQVIKAYTLQHGGLDKQLFDDIGVKRHEHSHLFELWFNRQGGNLSTSSRDHTASLSTVGPDRDRTEIAAANRTDTTAHRVESLGQTGELEHSPQQGFAMHQDAGVASDKAFSASVASSTESSSFKPSAHPSGEAATSSSTAEILIWLPTWERANHIASNKVGISHRAGVQLVPERGSGCEAMLRILGPPHSTALACYMVQKVMWLDEFFSRTV